MALFPFLILLNLLHNQQIALSVPMGYILSGQALPWQEAEDYCMSTYATHLASIQGDTEYNNMSAVASKGGNGVWIGLNDKTSEGVWDWSDGTECVNNNCITDTHWDSSTNQPDGGADDIDCAVIYHNFGYADENCASYRHFICNDNNRTLATTIPTTSIPTTLMPTTNMPTTMIPTTSNPTTSEPTTIIPTTLNPTTSEPTTSVPTSSNPTTSKPTTIIPITSNPTSSKPTTNEPTTMNPTTSKPTTSTSTTSSPTNVPSKSPDDDGQAPDGTKTTGKENMAAFNDGDDSLDLVLILVIIAAILSIFICLLILYLYLKRKKKREQNDVHGVELGIVKSESEYGKIIGSSPGSISSNKSLSTNINMTETTNTTVTMHMPGSQENIMAIDNDAYSNDNALKMWLNNIQMIEYYDLFKENGFCDHVDSLKKLTNDELKEMGITKMAHRIKILSQIESNVADREGVKNMNMNNNDDDDTMYQKQKGHETTRTGGDYVTDLGGNDIENVNNENIEDDDNDGMYSKGGGATSGQ